MKRLEFVRDWGAFPKGFVGVFDDWYARYLIYIGVAVLGEKGGSTVHSGEVLKVMRPERIECKFGCSKPTFEIGGK